MVQAIEPALGAFGKLQPNDVIMEVDGITLGIRLVQYHHRLLGSILFARPHLHSGSSTKRARTIIRRPIAGVPTTNDDANN